MRVPLSLIALALLVPQSLWASYTYSIFEHWAWDGYSITPSSVSYDCTGYMVDSNFQSTGVLVAGTCTQDVEVRDYTDWRWINFAGDYTSLYPPGPWVEGPLANWTIQETITTQSFSYWDPTHTISTGYQVGDIVLEITKQNHSAYRTRSPLIPPDPDPPTPAEPATIVLVGTAGFLRAQRLRKLRPTHGVRGRLG
ncbi:MAG: hypothetical protein SGI92_10125 [Bryobacteraceae bacterium]|nr:hypothetical protein [Bryobacteraceae bacterium]